jgi:predicted phage-related endonuclease
MTTKLEKELKREIDVDGKHYTVTISPGGLKIAEKGHRKGHELTWKQILSGEHELSQDLAKSLDRPPSEGSSGPATH